MGKRVAAILAAACAFALTGTVASAEGPSGLSKSEMQRLWHGDTIVRTQALERGDEHYVGGVTYTVLDARADDVPALFTDVDTLRRVLPRTRAARDVGSADGDALIQLTQGTAFVQATYTMRLHLGGQEVRFWMDRRRSHDISDAWGFLRASPLPDGRSLVTYGVLIDIGPGLLRDMFENHVRDLALSVADRMKGIVLERNPSGARATR